MAVDMAYVPKLGFKTHLKVCLTHLKLGWCIETHHGVQSNTPVFRLQQLIMHEITNIAGRN